MKRAFILLIAGIVTLTLTACGNPEGEADGDVIYIQEKMFVEQMNYIYLNGEKYVGKTIKYVGFLDILYDENGEPLYYYVIRYGPGCCGYDANVGFEIRSENYPEYNDWVEVEGIIRREIVDMYQIMYLDVLSIVVLPERGNESVS